MNSVPTNSMPYYRQPSTDSTDSITMALEWVFGLFLMPGIGWIYAGNYGMGIGVFVGYWVLIALEVFITMITFGLFACFAAPINLGLVILSGFRARDWVRKNEATGSLVRVVFAVIVAIAIVVGLIFFGIFGLGLFGALAGEMIQ